MRQTKRAVFLSVFVLMAVFAAGTALAQGQGKGKGGGHVEVTGNNLSFPVLFVGGPMSLRGTPGAWDLVGALDSARSFGCLKPETVGTTIYDNTSCVEVYEDGTFRALTAEECVNDGTAEGTKAGPCAGFDIYDIYWQKTESVWQAGSEQDTGAVGAAYLDWSDNLESTTWHTRSVVRVEAVPFNELPEGTSLMGFEMWHVFGQGPSEIWGVRSGGTTPYVYDSKFATVHTSNARMLFSKLETGKGSIDVPPDTEFTWDDVQHVWDGAVTNRSVDPGAELNVGGRVIYGYNWQLRNFPVDAGVEKAGWWRITFYTTDRNIDFTDGTILTAPPSSGDSYPGTIAPSFTTLEGDTGPVFTPDLDPDSDITWIDIYIEEKISGGGHR